MFDFPQPGEIYRSAGFPDVAVVGILEDGIPWEMPYRCPGGGFLSPATNATRDKAPATLRLTGTLPACR